MARPALPPAKWTMRAHQAVRRAASKAVMFLGLFLAAIAAAPALVLLTIGAGIWLLSDWLATRLET